MSKLWELWYAEDPWLDYPFYEGHVNLSPWHKTQHIFETVTALVKPELIVEVGSWKGDSAIRMAELTPDTTQIICIDTWLGGVEAWRRDCDYYPHLRIKHGRPQVYDTFMCNVIAAGFQHRITPVSQTSRDAIQLLHHFALFPNIVYIDGSHNYEEVFHDLCEYWNIVEYDGVLFGDDYFDTNVRRAVLEFANEEYMKPEIFNEYVYYVFRKGKK
jgi:hypothetical protein